MNTPTRKELVALNQLIDTKVTLLIDELSSQCELKEIDDNIAAIKELMQIRAFKEAILRKRLMR